MTSNKMERVRALLREDYKRATGTSFEHFFCPILWRDERTDLCLGHVVNQAIPNSFRGSVLQRKDVDGFFGQHFESEFTTLIRTRDLRPSDVFRDAELRKQMRPKLRIRGED